MIDLPWGHWGGRARLQWNVKRWPAVVDLSESVASVTELPAGGVVPASCAPCDDATDHANKVNITFSPQPGQ